MIADFTNGVFEMLGAVAVFVHCRQLYHDKLVRGVSWKATLFMVVWGYWNLYYYPHLDQWWSLGGAGLIALANTIWLVLMIYYILQEMKRV